MRLPKKGRRGGGETTQCSKATVKIRRPKKSRRGSRAKQNSHEKLQTDNSINDWSFIARRVFGTVGRKICERA
jgi:hypothetical protein